MAKKIMQMVTQAHYGAGGEVEYQPGHLFPQGAKLPDNIRVTDVIVDTDEDEPGFSVPEGADRGDPNPRMGATGREQAAATPAPARDAAGGSAEPATARKAPAGKADGGKDDGPKGEKPATAKASGASTTAPASSSPSPAAPAPGAGKGAGEPSKAADKR